jgi:hypothetical protein
MELGWGRRALRATVCCVSRPGMVLAAACALALAGCTFDGQPNLSAAQPHGATVAFESIDGLPSSKFATLVQSLNDEAQSRHLAVISRESQSAYRVRGYLAAKVVKGRTTIAWVWDVFDGDEHRALRITGEETAKSPTLGRQRDAWSAADDAMLKWIARTSMEQLAAFLTSPEVAPSTPIAAGEPQVMLVGERGPSPEAAGIFRIFHPQADPIPAVSVEVPAAAGDNVDSVPLPRRRPALPEAISAQDTRVRVVASQ